MELRGANSRTVERLTDCTRSVNHLFRTGRNSSDSMADRRFRLLGWVQNCSLLPGFGLGCDVGALTVVSCQDAPNREVFVQEGPMQSERGALDPVQSLGRSSLKSGIAFDREGHLETTLHFDVDLAAFEVGTGGTISQNAHATSQE